MIKYADTIQNPARLLSMTGLSIDEFHALLVPFHDALDVYMEQTTMAGYARESRQYVSYRNSPLPSTEDKLLFILTYLKQNPIQQIQGQLFEMSQSNVSKWVYILHTVLNRALAQQHVLPSRDAATLVQHGDAKPAQQDDSPPFFSMMVPSGQSGVR